MQQIDVSPPTNVYATFGRLNYTPWHAIAEFVDNATQSFIYGKRAGLLENLTVRIDYSQRADRLTIRDNALGMTSDQLARAILLSKPPEDRSGRSEFGMGLKTAACWFGSLWSVTTSCKGDPRQHRVVFDVEKVAAGERHVEIEETYVDLDLHGTTVEISQLSRPIAGRQIEKTKRLLASIYRVDITSGDVALSWNKERLWFRTPDLMNREVGGTIQPARAPIDLAVKDPYTGTRHRVTGWVGAMQRMSQTDAGLALLRRGRMIIGGPDANWRPREVVGSLNSHSGKRLIGELHMDDFPVNFTKDGFAWDAGLEEELINALAPAVQDLRSFADNARVAAKKIEPEDFVRAVDEVQRGVSSPTYRDAANRREEPIQPSQSTANPFKPFDLPAASNTPERVGDLTPTVHRDVPQELILPVGVKTMRARLVLVHGGPTESWLEVTQSDDFTLSVRLNTGNRFVAQHLENEAERTLIAKFALAVATAEAQARLVYDDEVPPDELRRFLSLTLDHSASQ